MANKDLRNMPYATWLEEALRGLVELNVKGIAMFATTETGDLYSNYHNISMADKLYISGIVQQDAMMDTLAANGVVEFEEEEE